MRTVHLNTYDVSGGAARAAYRLHQGLREKEVDSSIFVETKNGQDETVGAWTPSGSLLDGLRERVKSRWLHYRLHRYQETRPDRVEIFSQARTAHGYRVARSVPGADIYNLHWIRGFIDPLPFFQVIDQPVVWTLHDMNAFTGGCHYSAGCRQFEDACGRCPQLGSDNDDDLSRSVWMRKQESYRQVVNAGRLHIVAPSEWLAREAKSSALLTDAPVHVIPYGLDHALFRPRETEGLRTALEIPSQHRIILFVAGSAQNHRKGFDLLVEALSNLTLGDVTLLSIGSKEPALDTQLPHVPLGTIESDPLLSVFYSLADLFVIPSRQDNLPNTVLESMACGTPVVGFETGGIPDMVRPGATGWLAESGNVRSLRNAIEEALNRDAERQRMGDRCREVVEEEFTLERQARQYKTLYEDLLAQHQCA